MGQIEVGIISLIIIIVVLLFLLAIRNGGPNYKPSQLNAWNYGLTKTTPLTCMGFVHGPQGLDFQYNPSDLDGSKNLPNPTIDALDAKGNVQKLTRIPTMGRQRYEKAYLVKDGDKDIIVTKGFDGFDGDHNSCCNYAINSGGRGAAVFDPRSHRCYVFDWMGKKDGAFPTGKPERDAKGAEMALKRNTLVNQFPLFDHEMLPMDQIPSTLESDEYVYMVPCGGQGHLPCKTQTRNQKETGVLEKAWPPEQEGCSQKGGKGAIHLYRTPSRSPLPYSDKENDLWELCETMPYIKGFGYHPAGWSQANKWDWAVDLPKFDPKKPVHPFDPNTSNAWFMTPDQTAG